MSLTAHVRQTIAGFGDDNLTIRQVVDRAFPDARAMNTGLSDADLQQVLSQVAQATLEDNQPSLELLEELLAAVLEHTDDEGAIVGKVLSRR